MTKPDATPDARLAAFFAAELPPARDLGFQAEVMAAMARRRFVADMVLLSTVTTLAGIGLWLVWPVVAPVLEALARGLAPGLAAVIAAASIVALTTGRILSPRS
jgi:DNA primase